MQGRPKDQGARAGAMGFPAAKADTPACRLSGGERARILLGLATLAGAHLIVLDEPTNHLDIDSRAALITGINSYPGAVMLVSHDRYLIEACADRLWLVANGQVVPFDGDLDEYRDLVLAERGGVPRRQGSQGRGRPNPPTDRAAAVEIRRAAAEKRTSSSPSYGGALLRKPRPGGQTVHGQEIAAIDAAAGRARGLFARRSGAGRSARQGTRRRGQRARTRGG